MAKCNLGEVKLERIGLRPPPIAVRDMWGGPLGSCRASLGVCRYCCTALLLCSLIIADHLYLACVASVSVGFGSKEGPRNGVFGILTARKMGREPKKERWG